MTDIAANPFAPGYGGKPPHIAGREAVQSSYAKALGNLVAGTPKRGIVMYGPRGMGKTTMLHWLEEQCREQGLAVTLANPDESGGLAIEDFSDLLSDKLTLDQVSLDGNVGVNLGLKAQATFKASWSSSQDKTPRRLQDHLIAACKESPRVLLLDEAHTMNESACRSLLSMTQKIMLDLPFLLVLAGTPGLTQFLGSVGATFVERSQYRSIGRLTAEAAADAIAIPLESDGIKIEADTLEQVVEDSQRYPFFLQLWGEALWDVAKEHGLDTLTTDHLSLAAPLVQEERQGFYGRRYSRLRKNNDLLTAAKAVSEAFKGGTEAVARTEIERMIAASLEGVMPDDNQRREKATVLTDELNSIDYIWDPNETQQMEPGIPSFMTYVMEQS